MTQGVKYTRYHKEAWAVRSVDFFCIYRGNIRSSRKEKQPTGTRGLHQSLNWTVKKPWIGPIHVVKPHALTNCKPHKHSDRSCHRVDGRGVSGCTDWGGISAEAKDAWDDHKEREEITVFEWGADGRSAGMSALLTFRRRHVGWRRGSSAEEDDKAVKWK